MALSSPSWIGQICCWCVTRRDAIHATVYVRQTVLYKLRRNQLHRLLCLPHVCRQQATCWISFSLVRFFAA
jgi:hypothetical protein